MKLDDRTVVISGATGELGFILAQALAAEQAKLALIGKDSQKLAVSAGALGLPEERVMAVTADLLNPVQTQAAAGAIAERFGRVDALLHLAGGWTGGKSLVEAPPEDLEFMLKQHVWTSLHVIQAFVPHVVKNSWGRVVMISSPFASRPAAKGGPYAAGKAAQEALMLTLAQELKGTGVTANLLLVKTIDTQRKRVTVPSSENVSWSTPEEICAAVMYLLSDEAGVVNGAKIPLYGGMS